MLKRLTLLLTLGLFASLASSSPARAATNWQVPAGDPGVHDVDLLHFTILNHELRILPGDTVTWTNRGSGAPHTVTFLAGGPWPPFMAPGPGGLVIANPAAAFPSHREPSPTWAGATYANSGMLMPGQSWSLTFTTTGTYEYVCLLHPSMTSRVVVEQSGTTLRVTQADIDANFEAHSALHQRQAAAAAQGLLTPDVASGPGGTTSWRVAAGKTTPQAALNAFLPSTLQIREGDTVRWQWDGSGREPHTVTFLAGEPHPGEPIVPQFQPQGPPLLVAPDRFWRPSSPEVLRGTTYDGVGFLSSGGAGLDARLMSPELSEQLAENTRQEWSVTFPKAGTYPYVCLLHPGMQGVVEVMPRAAWPPLDVQVAAIHSEDLVTFRINLRNRGSQTLERVVVAAPVPDGARFVDSWMGNEFDNKGAFTGRDVLFAQADVSISPGRNLGPYVFTVRARPGVDPHDLLSRAWVSFAQGRIAGSALTGWVAPLSPDVEVEHGH